MRLGAELDYVLRDGSDLVPVEHVLHLDLARSDARLGAPLMWLTVRSVGEVASASE